LQVAFGLHLRDKHKGKWDTFSIYLTINVGHMKEIESLILRVARPPGNSVGGKPSASRDLVRAVRKEIRAKLDRETDLLIGRIKATTGETIDAKEEAGALLYFLPRGAQLRATNRGKTFKARLLKNGRFGMTALTISQSHKLPPRLSKGPQMAGGFGKSNVGEATG